MDKAARDNRSNQMNPNHSSYQGGGTRGYTTQKCYLDNRANQLNPNHPAYASSRAGSTAAAAAGSEQSGGWGCVLM